MPSTAYIGRFAPSPTGALHFGSLVAALASYLDAKSNGGRWLLRMEDLDTERTRRGVALQILRDLERFGLHWDGPVIYQSQRIAAYQAIFEHLRSAGCLYPCACSRRDSAGRHRGVCTTGLQDGQQARSWRFRVPPSAVIRFEDRVQGVYLQDVHAAVGDFIVRRADGPFAYQLAVVVDDAAGGVTHVVRGADLFDNTPRQICLQQCLRLPTPQYAHIPVATDENGRKLSKSTGAAVLDSNTPERELRRALTFLGHEPPWELHGAPSADLLQWGIEFWSIGNVPRTVVIDSKHKSSPP